MNLRNLRNLWMLTLLCVVAIFLATGESAQAQTGTTVTGVTKTSDQLTPLAAGLVKYGRQAPGAIDVYGKIEFRACETDSTGKCVRYREVECGGVTYQGPSIAYIKGDGAWIDAAGAAGAKRVPNSGCTPAGLATEAKIFLQRGCAPGSTGCTAIVQRDSSEITQVKVIPDQASVDWSSIAAAAAATPAASKQDQDRGKVLNSEEWTRVAAATVPNAATAADNLFIELADNKLKAKDSAGVVRELGGAGGGGYTTILDEAVALAQRTTVNFIGAGVACVDNAGATRTDCTIAGGGGGSLTVEEVDLAPSVASVTTLRFDQADGFVVSTPGAGIARVDLAAIPDSALATISTVNKVAAAAIDDGGAASTQALFSGAAGSAGFRAIADADVPDSITITLAATATALAANPTDCAANQFANAIAASGNLTCAAIADADVPDTITAANYLPLAGGTLTGTATLRAGAAGAGTAPLKFQAGALNTAAEAHAFEWDGTDLYATNAVPARKRLIYSDGSITGNAATATALAADPADCPANQVANAIAASGALTCSALTLAGAQFANQGTTTQVLHGNAAGNPSWAAVSLTADVSGILPKTNLPTAIAYEDESNTWTTGTQDFEGAAVTRPFRRLAFASFPGTCTANREFLERSDPAVAGQVVYVCNSAGTGWDLVGDGGAGGSNHAILSATHTDTVAATVVRGDLMTGQGVSPTWQRKAIGAANTFLGSDATDATWTSLTLASAQFANQGSTTTVAHGNAAGNPSWAAVSLTADVSGILGSANGGTGNGFTKFSGPTTSEKTFTLPDASATLVTTTRTLTGGAGIAAIGDLSADRTIATASGEADFLASGALTCGASTQGKMQVHTTPLQYCDNAATPALQYAAYGDSSGNAKTGDAFASFFPDTVASIKGTLGVYYHISGGTVNIATLNDSDVLYLSPYGNSAPVTTDDNLYVIPIGVAGTVNQLCVSAFVGTTGTSENVTFVARKNKTTDTAQSVILTFNTASPGPTCTTITTAMTVAVGDGIGVKQTNPVWVTNPANLRVRFTIAILQDQ